MRTDRIHAYQVNVHPWGLCGSTQSLDAVAGTAVSPNDSLLLGLFENIHHATVTFGPIAFCYTVNKAHVEIVCAKLPPEAIQISAGLLGITRPRFGENSHFVT